MYSVALYLYIQASNYIWTIRLKNQPEKIIGVCALHHWNKIKKDIEIGGTLLPEYWGKNMMKRVFEQLLEFVGKLWIDTIIGKKSPRNIQAIKMVEK